MLKATLQYLFLKLFVLLKYKYIIYFFNLTHLITINTSNLVNKTRFVIEINTTNHYLRKYAKLKSNT